MKTIKLELTLDEVNKVLLGLQEMPFKQVNGLIGKIQEQAKPQLEDKKDGETAQS